MLRKEKWSRVLSSKCSNSDIFWFLQTATKLSRSFTPFCRHIWRAVWVGTKISSIDMLFTSYLSYSYPKMKDLVDHVFPSLHRQRTAFSAPHEYSSFTFWRTPLPTIEVNDPLLKKTDEKKDPKWGKVWLDNQKYCQLTFVLVQRCVVNFDLYVMPGISCDLLLWTLLIT